jgi:hypothetical protein
MKQLIFLGLTILSGTIFAKTDAWYRKVALHIPGYGSAVYINNRIALSARHVCTAFGPMQGYEISLRSYKSEKLQVVAYEIPENPSYDICIILLDKKPAGVPEVTMQPDEELINTQSYYKIPGFSGGRHYSLSMGFAMEKEVHWMEESPRKLSQGYSCFFISLSCPINPGGSGSGVFNVKTGRLVAITIVKIGNHASGVQPLYHTLSFLRKAQLGKYIDPKAYHQ